jgi:hypothetical protein
MPGPGPGAGLTLAQLRSRVKGTASFADDDPVVDQVLNDKHRQMVVESGWDRRIIQVGTTVVDQAEYDLDAGVVDVIELTVDDGPYTGTDVDSLFRLRKGLSRLTGSGGVYADFYEADGTQQLALYPTPDEAGLAIEALVSWSPTDLTDNDYPVVPRDFHQNIADGTIAELLRQHQDGDPTEAAVLEQRFVEAIEKLRRRRNSRARSGPVQMQVRGVHFR